jgi:hypothetical protein
MRDKGLNQIATGVFEDRSAAKVSGVRFDQYGIEVVLADEHTQSVSQSRLTVVRTIPVRLLDGILLLPGRTGGTGKPAQLLN